ncbi:aminoacyl carrier protein [Deltaproteobacteria bacterium]|nr:aminoacyl carrier protein [Deltaproteobacteria bacterium]
MLVDDIRNIIVKHGRLTNPEGLTATSDLYAAGLSSLTTVHLMLALEDHFGVEFPDRVLGRKTFESIQSLAEVIEELKAAA